MRSVLTARVAELSERFKGGGYGVRVGVHLANDLVAGYTSYRPGPTDEIPTEVVPPRPRLVIDRSNLRRQLQIASLVLARDLVVKVRAPGASTFVRTIHGF